MNETSARTRILGRIRQALGQEREYSEAVFRRLLAAAPKAHTHLSTIANPVDVFMEQAETTGGQVVLLPSAAQVPAWLQQSSFGALPIALSDQADIIALDWSNLDLQSDYRSHGQVGVVKASLAAAETGTLLLHSHEVASGLLYLVDRLVVVLQRTDIKARYEDLWTEGPQKSAEGIPRAVHLITGPSRTADVEQTIQVGAHGPRELYIILLEDD